MGDADHAIGIDEPDGPSPAREVRHEYTRNWPAILAHLKSSLILSTYQAGKLVVVRAVGDELALAYHNFERAMGVAVSPGSDRIAVGTRSQVWTLRAAPEIAAHVEPAGAYDACFLARSSHFTGEVQGHELAWSGADAKEPLWMVNTMFSCLCTLDDRHSFVPRWRPPFISDLAAEDRCHLNGLATDAGRPRFVTAMAESDAPRGWRETKATGGCVIDVASGSTVLRGLAMPHSPRWDGSRLWLLDSGRGRLVAADPARGTLDTVAELPGYTRGLALFGGFAFVGLSKIRETSTFGGVPIAERRASLRCGVAIVDLASGRPIALLEFLSGVEEIFDVQLLPGIRSAVLSGPYPEADGTPPIWMVPRPGRTHVM